MAVLILIGTAIFGAAVWYFRFRGPAAIGDAVDAATTLKGAYNRRQFRKKSEGATLTAIDDPGLGAAVYLVSLAEAGPGLGPGEEAAITTFLRDTVQYGDPAEAITFAKWASREVVDVDEVGRRLLPLWRERLSAEERRAILAAANAVAAIRGPDDAQTASLRRLKERFAG
ncbi:MAG: hypothetical protein ACWA6X_12050 [Bauldia sp.]|jgi:hypothetical protein